MSFQSNGQYVPRLAPSALDQAGDIHIIRRMVLATPGQDPVGELNTVLLGVVLTTDEDFNQILERGFAGAIRREWAWRTSRGHSLHNLKAFRHMIETTS